METEILGIREAKESDRPSICRLSDDINLDHYANMPRDFIKPAGSDRDEPYWRSSMENGSSAVFIAEDGGKVIGAIAVSVSASAPYPFIVSRPRGYVGTVVVAKGQCRRGTGRQLMSAAESFASGQGAADIRLEVMAFNDDALDFY
jgi:ribosomal protein S18 acetylase RimI-like enzyme